MKHAEAPSTRPSRKQDRGYWDNMAASWDDEIFNSLHHDKFGIIAEELRRSARAARSVADFGCGTGNYLPFLSRLFEHVHGFERSRPCVAMAQALVGGLGHVAVHPASAGALRRFGRFDVVLCANVAVHPSLRARQGILRSVRSLLAPGGRLILIVPALESARMVAAAERSAPGGQAGGAGDWDADSHAGGVVTIEGMPYKHYGKEELRWFLKQLGFAVLRIRRVKYSWGSQGVRATPDIRDTLPWDWIAVGRRTSGVSPAGA